MCVDQLGNVSNPVDNIAIQVPGVEGSCEQFAALLEKDRVQPSAQSVQAIPQWCSPRLVPMGRPDTGATCTCGAPPFYAVRTTPRGVLNDFDFCLRWPALQEL